MPPHERPWRHPSEMGGAMWAHTEPPLTIGRGLLITTGAIGGLLSLAVLWAMLPSAGRGGIAEPTVVTSTANERTGPIATARADNLVATSVEALLPTTSAFTTTPVTSPASSSPTTTSTTATQPSVTIKRTDDYPAAPVAVGVGDSLVITTARAVEGRTSISITGSDGQLHDATVLMVDREVGLAVLSADTATTTNSYGIGPAAVEGDVVTVLGTLPVSANVRVDAEGHLTLDTWADSMAEGTPIINADGLLVAMCTHGASGPELVSVANVAAMLPAAKRAQASPYLGVHVVDSDHGAPVVDGVDATGPAVAAGLIVGDTIAAVDGNAIGGVDQLKAAIAAHLPGDAVTLTITHADQTSNDVTVTLATTPAM
ncbi:MAG: PDZ domain-containing protein [Ilumatobacteraceae bacterium]